MPMPPAPSRRSIRKSPTRTPASRAAPPLGSRPADSCADSSWDMRTAQSQRPSDYRQAAALPIELSRRSPLRLAVERQPDDVADADPRPSHRIELDLQAAVSPAPTQSGHLADLLLAAKNRIAQRHVELAVLQPARAAHVPRRVALIPGVVTLDHLEFELVAGGRGRLGRHWRRLLAQQPDLPAAKYETREKQAGQPGARGRHFSSP